MKFILCFLMACAGALAFGQQTAPAANPLDPLSFMKGDWAGKQDFNNEGGPAMVGEATDRIDVCIAGKYLCDAGGHDFDYCRLQMMFRWQAALRIRKRPDFGSRQGASCEDCDKGRHHS